jgi:hypothetical protein
MIPPPKPSLLWKKRVYSYVNGNKFSRDCRGGRQAGHASVTEDSHMRHPRLAKLGEPDHVSGGGSFWRDWHRTAMPPSPSFRAKGRHSMPKQHQFLPTLPTRHQGYDYPGQCPCCGYSIFVWAAYADAETSRPSPPPLVLASRSAARRFARNRRHSDRALPRRSRRARARISGNRQRSA